MEWTVKENTDYTLSLWIMDVQAEDFGEYTCYARNALGKAKDSVVLYGKLHLGASVKIMLHCMRKEVRFRMLF